MMVMSHMAVNERLRQLNEAFNASLNGMDRRSNSDNELSSRASPLSVGAIGYTGSHNASRGSIRATGHIRRATTTTSASSSTGLPLDIVIPVPGSSSGSNSPSGSLGGLGFEPEPRPREHVRSHTHTHAHTHTHTRTRRRSLGGSGGGSGGSEEINIVGRLELNESDKESSSNISRRGSALRHGQ